MAKVPKKNISWRMNDIRSPKAVEPRLENFELEKAEHFFKDGPPKRVYTKKHRSLWGWIAIFLVSVLVLFVCLVAVNAYFLERKLARSVKENAEQFQLGVTNLKLLDPAQAAKEFATSDRSNFSPFEEFTSRFMPLLRGGPDVFFGFRDLSSKALVLSMDVKTFGNNLFDYVVNKKGDVLIADLAKIQGELQGVNIGATKLYSVADKLRSILPVDPGSFLPLQFDLNRFQNFLGNIIVWLKEEKPHHIAVFFDNPSEIRPGGGFLGSYADLTIQGGAIQTIDVHDINDVDRTLDRNLIPPKPLQALVNRWRAADANWFFNFPDSAATVLQIMESSHLYKDQNITFDGAVAVSPKVFADLLAATGPIELKDKHLTFDENNFLVEIQKQVQYGQANRATYPKKILEELAPLVLDRLGNASDEDKAVLFDKISDWISKRDILVYFKDHNFETFADSYGATGRVYDPPRDFEGDYLALVNANIGGAKTDLYMKESVTFQSQINLDGTVNDHVSVSRMHEGKKAKYPWYRATNNEYIELLTPKGSQISNFQGGVKKHIVPPINYAKLGYEKIPLLDQIESSTKDVFVYPALENFEEANKNVFATWSMVKLGETKEISFDYTSRLFLAPKEEQAYEFVFEKQAGTRRSYDFEISAPVGFKFKENNLPIYEYKSNDPPGRLIVDLTLEKI